MKHMKVAFSHKVQFYFGSLLGRDSVDISKTDFTDIAAIVISESDIAVLDNEIVKSFDIPVFLVVFDKNVDIDQFMGKVERIIDVSSTNFELYKRQIEAAAERYETSILPPFFRALANYVEAGNSQFDCPGIKVDNSSVNILRVVHFTIFMEKMYSALIFVMLT